MIGTVDVEVQAANPNMPLHPWRAFVSSPSSLRLRNVPKRIGDWHITSVSIVAVYPDGSIVSAECVLTGGVWVGTVAGTATSGTSENGYTVMAAGVDENGRPVTGYVLGKGNIEILQADGTLAPDAPAYYVKLFDEAPDVPKEGYAYMSGGTLYIYDGTAWTAIGGAAPSDDSKLDGAAAYEAWESGIPYPAGAVVSHNGRLWRVIEPNTPVEPSDESPDWEMTTIDSLKQNALSVAQLAAVNSGATAAKVATWDGYAAQIAQKANAADVNAALAQKASLTDLPYALVTPGEWSFSDGQVRTITGPAASIGGYNYYADSLYASQEFETEADALDALMLDFTEFTATRASLPGHLLDRAGNRVVVTGDTTLTLPAAVPGYCRDFLVRLEISGSTVPTITFQGQGSEAPNGADEITYETDGDEFPVPDEAGDWLYSFTESCVAHKFAVSLKKVNTVAQGGS